MADHRLTPLVESLPSTVPFVGPETQERSRGRPFRARIGANESVFGPSPHAVAAMQAAAVEAWKYCDPENHDLKQALASAKPKVVGIVMAETSTGAWQPLERHACRTCGSLQLHWREASGLATVDAVTEISRAPTDAFRALAPYTLVLATLDEGPRVMGIELGTPVGRLPIGEVPDHPTRLSQPALEGVQPEREQAAFAFKRQGAAPAAGGLAQGVGGLLRADTHHQPGGQGHAHQQPLDMRQHPHLPAFPLPAGGFVIAETGFNRVAPPVEGQQRPVGGQIAHQQQRPAVAFAPVGHPTGFPPAVFLEHLAAAFGALPRAAHQGAQRLQLPGAGAGAGLALHPHHPVPAVGDHLVGKGRGAKGPIGQPGDRHPHRQQLGHLRQQRPHARPEALPRQGRIGRPTRPGQRQGAPAVPHRRRQHDHPLVLAGRIQDQHQLARAAPGQMMAGKGMHTQLRLHFRIVLQPPDLPFQAGRLDGLGRPSYRSA